MILKFRLLPLIFLSLLACMVAIKPQAAHGQTIYCASDDGGRHYCNANTRGGVQLTNQRSGSACIQGRTWGWDNNGIWVDKGCRAEFTTRNGNGNGWGNGGGWGGNNGSGQTLYCASDDGGRHYCNANTRGGVRLTNQRSGSPCNQGQTWGWDNNGIWVDKGCRAEFTVGNSNGNGWGNGHGNGWGNGGSVGQTFTCSSNNGGRNYCSIPRGVNPNNITLSRQISGSACNQGQTWGVDRRGLWVDKGCRAEFRSNF
ncbi:DUF3011 domain-containing protein [Edaphobacter albus]|uniref:DUF3011 domain-containing protein n=1 Tax=Edaphobacter sp. 4G125 TaxID=2763071 RepID=UPI001648207D|nr:DUF3011 domain-containing protein [Edaphobacter sp. 4G125]QNI35772.1 DUF3011 domain-containing protein [Edaphobacter sp. 4G125]